MNLPGGATGDEDSGGTAPTDLAGWRTRERERLLRARLALSSAYRASQTQAIAEQLTRLVPRTDGTLVSVYWPMQGEPDLRPWMHMTWESGVRVALPVALAVGQPLTFRLWSPQATMSRGLWKIPFPAEGDAVIPTVVVAPLLGFDLKRYRLGYGGGFFDRTLGGMSARPLVLGVGYPNALLSTIFPQQHDIPMDQILTGDAL